jgi:hypothetical protein
VAGIVRSVTVQIEKGIALCSLDAFFVSTAKAGIHLIYIDSTIFFADFF